MIHILMTTALCSLIPFGPPSTSTTMLLATATADSALAGLGGVTPSAHGGHWGPGAERTVYGQVYPNCIRATSRRTNQCLSDL